MTLLLKLGFLPAGVAAVLSVLLRFLRVFT